MSELDILRVHPNEHLDASYTEQDCVFQVSGGPSGLLRFQGLNNILSRPGPILTEFVVSGFGGWSKQNLKQHGLPPTQGLYIRLVVRFVLGVLFALE